MTRFVAVGTDIDVESISLLELNANCIPCAVVFFTDEETELDPFTRFNHTSTDAPSGNDDGIENPTKVCTPDTTTLGVKQSALLVEFVNAAERSTRSDLNA
jgi:hypothetical protein